MAFVGAPINDMTGKISDKKGGGSPGGGFEATTAAVGEEGGAINPPSSGGPDVKADDPKGGGGGAPPPAMTMAIGEDGTGAITNPPAAPGTPVEALPVDLGTENIEGGPAVLPGFDPTNVPVAPDLENPLLIDPNVEINFPENPNAFTRAIGEDGNGPSLIDLIGKEPFNEVTTMAVGEEGDFPPQPGNDILQPPGGTLVTTQAVGEEEGDMPFIGGGVENTRAIGEDNSILQPPGQLLTQAMYEDGMPTPPRPPQPQPFQPQLPTGGGKGGGMQPQPQPVQPFQPYQPQPYQPQPFQPYQPVYQPPPPMYGGSFYGGGFGSPYGGGFGGGYGMQRPQPFGGNFYGNPYTPPPPPTPYGGGGKGGGFGQQQMPQPQMQPQPQPQPGGKGGGQAPIGQNSTGGNFGNAPSQVATQAYSEDDFIAPPKDPNAPSPLSNPGGLFSMLGAGSLLGGQQNTGGSSNNASPFGGSSGGGSRTAMF